LYKAYTCDSCEAAFKIKHSLDESFFEVNFCPFCSAQIDDDDEQEPDEFE
jgi:hypothetical protein